MSHETVRVTTLSVESVSHESISPELVERAGGAARFALDEFFYAEHHNLHTQKVYQSAVRRFLAWVEGPGVGLVGITPGMVRQYIVGFLGSAANRRRAVESERACQPR